jgi:uncharacterized protein
MPDNTREAPTRLRAGRVWLMLVIMLVLQVLGAILGVLGEMLWKAIQGVNIQDPQYLQAHILEIMAPAIVVSVLFSSVITLLISFFWFRSEIHHNDPNGACWVRGASAPILIGLVIGVILALFYLPVSLLFSPENASGGPLSQMASSPGTPQISWMLLGLLVAPISEELFFRGVFYGGLHRSWGRWWAGIVPTFVFVVLHITEMMYFWPSVIFVTGLAILTLWIRLRSRAIAPAIALHFAYNSILAIAVCYVL